MLLSMYDILKELESDDLTFGFTEKFNLKKTTFKSITN